MNARWLVPLSLCFISGLGFERRSDDMSHAERADLLFMVQSAWNWVQCRRYNKTKCILCALLIRHSVLSFHHVLKNLLTSMLG